MLQGFVKEGDSGFRSGSLTITTLSDVAVRVNLASGSTPEEVVPRLAAASGAGLLRTILVARRLITESRGRDEDKGAGATSLLVPEIIARLQPNSFSSGTMKSPGVARTPAVISSTTKVTIAITHA